LLGHHFQPYKVKNMICPVRQKIADGLDGIYLRGVYDVRGAESPGRVEPLRLDVDDNDPGSAGDERPTNGVKPNSSGAEDRHSIAGANVCRVQDGTSSGYNSTAEQRGLGEGKLTGHDGQLVLVDESPFGESAKPETLEQANPIAA
jgi:hypothetical protein